MFDQDCILRGPRIAVFDREPKILVTAYDDGLYRVLPYPMQASSLAQSAVHISTFWTNRVDWVHDFWHQESRDMLVATMGVDLRKRRQNGDLKSVMVGSPRRSRCASGGGVLERGQALYILEIALESKAKLYIQYEIRVRDISTAEPSRIPVIRGVWRATNGGAVAKGHSARTVCEGGTSGLSNPLLARLTPLS